MIDSKPRHDGRPPWNKASHLNLISCASPRCGGIGTVMVPCPVDETGDDWVDLEFCEECAERIAEAING